MTCSSTWGTPQFTRSSTRAPQSIPRLSLGYSRVYHVCRSGTPKYTRFSTRVSHCIPSLVSTRDPQTIIYHVRPIKKGLGTPSEGILFFMPHEIKAVLELRFTAQKLVGSRLRSGRCCIGEWRYVLGSAEPQRKPIFVFLQRKKKAAWNYMTSIHTAAVGDASSVSLPRETGRGTRGEAQHDNIKKAKY